MDADGLGRESITVWHEYGRRCTLVALTMRLFHVSDAPDIAEFVPRLASIDPALGPVV